jgi:hypothetical protein
MISFSAKLEPVPHGGHYVLVPEEVAVKAGLKHGARVRGTVGFDRAAHSIRAASAVAPQARKFSRACSKCSPLAAAPPFSIC